MFYLALHQSLNDVHVCYRSEAGKVYWFNMTPKSGPDALSSGLPASWHEQKSAIAEVSDLELFTDFYKDKGYIVEPVNSLNGLRGLLEQAQNVRIDVPAAMHPQGILPAHVFTYWHILEKFPD